MSRLWLWLVPVLLISSAITIRMLNADTLFVDEYWSIRNSAGLTGFDPVEVWNRTAYLDPGGMGVLYHWFLAVWEAVIGATPFSVRAFSLLWGLIAIVLTYRLGLSLHSARVGLYGALVMASSAFFIDYMHEARAYTMVVALSVCAVYCYMRLMRSHPHLLWYVGLTLSLTGLAYTHYITLAMGAVLGLYHLSNFERSRRWWWVVLAMAAAGVLFLPWMQILLEVVKRGTEQTGRQQTSMNNAQMVEVLFTYFSNLNLALMGLLAFYGLRDTNRKRAVLWIWFGASLALVMLVNARIPFMVHLRYLLFIWPALALIMAVGINRLKTFAVPVLVVWMAAGFYQSLNPAFIRDTFGQIYRAPAGGFHQALEVLEDRAHEGDLALLHIIPPGFEPFEYFPLDYYFWETPRFRIADHQSRLRFDQFERMNNSFAGGDNDYLVDVMRGVDGVDAVWAMQVPELEMTQRTGVVNYVLATHFAHCETVFERDDMRMNLYIRPPQGKPVALFGGGQLRLFDLGRGQQTADSVEVVLGWRARDVEPGKYSVAVHLFDQNGQFMQGRQYDVGLPDARPFSCMTAKVPLNGLPAGDYILRVKVYEWQTGNIYGDYVDFKPVIIGE